MLSFTVKSGEIWSKRKAHKYGPGGGVPRRAFWLTEPFHNSNHDMFRHFMLSQMGGAKFSSFSKGDLQVVASS
jgi:hypothetical protein